MVRWIADTATVDPAARLADGSRIGSFCVVGPLVRLSENVQIGSHAWLGGSTCVGPEVEIGEFSVLGSARFSKSGKPGNSKIRLGKGSTLGRAVVVEAAAGHRPTVIGQRCQVASLVKIEAGANLSSDVHLGAGVVVGVNAEIEAFAALGHGVTVSAGVRLGRNCAIGSLSKVTHNIPPHLLADGGPAVIRGVNVAGLQRLGVEPLGIAALMAAYRLIYRMGIPLDRAEQKLRAQSFWTPEVIELFHSLASSASHAFGTIREQGRVA